jgi:mRNA interferase MazF
LVLQADSFNRSRLQTVVVVSLTSNLRLSAAPGNVVCRPRGTGLRKPSVVNATQISTLDRSFLRFARALRASPLPRSSRRAPR